MQCAVTSTPALHADHTAQTSTQEQGSQHCSSERERETLLSVYTRPEKHSVFVSVCACLFIWSVFVCFSVFYVSLRVLYA